MANLDINLQRLSDARDDIYEAIINKGGTASSLDGFEDFAGDIATITNQYTAVDEGKVVSNGALVAQTSTNISANGTVNTTTNNEVVVNVPTGTPYKLALSSVLYGTVSSFELCSVNDNNSLTCVFGYFVYKTGSAAISTEFIEFSFNQAFTPAITTKKFENSSSSISKVTAQTSISNGKYRVLLSGSGLTPYTTYTIYIQTLFA